MDGYSSKIESKTCPYRPTLTLLPRTFREIESKTRPLRLPTKPVRRTDIVRKIESKTCPYRPTLTLLLRTFREIESKTCPF